MYFKISVALLVFFNIFTDSIFLKKLLSDIPVSVLYKATNMSSIIPSLQFHSKYFHWFYFNSIHSARNSLLLALFIIFQTIYFHQNHFCIFLFFILILTVSYTFWLLSFQYCFLIFILHNICHSHFLQQIIHFVTCRLF